MWSSIVAAGSVKLISKPAHPTNYSLTKRKPTLIVIHSTEGHEGSGSTDANVAAGIAVAKAGKSFHYVVDADSATQCVPDELTAWHARKTGNARGIGVEICGTAKQTRAQWLDTASLATLNNAARLIADLCVRHGIPPVVLGAEELKRNLSGITTHAAVSAAWGESTHWDPGPDFPLDEFVRAVADATAAVPGPA